MYSDRGGDVLSLWVSNLDGTDMRRFVSGGEESIEARWSPDGSRVAYVVGTGLDRTIVTRDADGMSVNEVARGGVRSPEWSPDGRSIAFYRIDGDGGFDVWVRPLGGEARQLTHGAHAQFATWSPDGREIAFHRQLGSKRQIWSAPAEGGELRQISRDDTLELSHPQWSPVDPDSILVVVDHLALGLVSVRTGAVNRLFGYDTSTVLVDYASWSPDGSKIYFSLGRKTGDVYLLQGL
jgi:Tol biopolymer transport system component